MLIEQLIDLRKVRTENLKFWTDLWDQAMAGWSVAQKMIVYKGRLLKKSVNKKLKLVLSSRSLHGIQTQHFICNLFGHNFAANFCYKQFRIMPDIVSKLLCTSIWSHCAIIFKSEQNQQMPFLRQEVDVDQLLYTGFDPEHAVLFLYPTFFTQKPMTDSKIGWRQIWSYGCYFGRQAKAASSSWFHQ